MNSIIKNDRGILDVELTFCALIFTILIMVFFQFFRMFHVSSNALLMSSTKAFQTVGQVSAVEGSGVTYPGLISTEELALAGGCGANGACGQFIVKGQNQIYNWVLGSLDYEPSQGTYLVLQDP